MSWEGRLEDFVGLPVRDFDPAQADLSGGVLRMGGDLGALLAMPRLDELSGLVLTCPPVEEVVASAGRLVGLCGLGLEGPWFGPEEVMALLGAFPWLDAFAVCAPRPQPGRVRHSGLRQLIVRAAGMPGQALLELFTSDLPGLRRLDLGLGSRRAGLDADELQPLLSGEAFPGLAALTLACDEEDVVATLLGAPLVEQLESLDLGRCRLTDDTLQPLLRFPDDAALRTLRLPPTGVSPAVQARLRERFPA